MPSKRRNQVDPLSLRPGDHVVHEQHGVGRFVELVQRTVQGATRDYLVIEYAPSKRGHPGDRLFVPMDQLDQLSRYVGSESPALDKMGGADWTKRKAKARRAVREISAELIKLYAARQATKGHAFGPDTAWQRELEDAFSFVETPDQLSAIVEVKADMENLVPMDRLICGDVGYGKTEIAVRAAFKAVQDGKQVAVLVPTTRRSRPGSRASRCTWRSCRGSRRTRRRARSSRGWPTARSTSSSARTDSSARRSSSRTSASSSSTRSSASASSTRSG
jgi:transcription-repair coupling factor (superfamily II helicase)